MEKSGPYFVIGFFVLIGLIGAIGFALWLGGSIDTGKYSTYTLYFADPVSGLKEGASVQYRGIDVGKVVGVGLSKVQKNVIRVDIQIEPEVPVSAGTVGQLEVFGITGLVYISLSTDPSVTDPPAHIEGEKYPVITGHGTQFSKLMNDIPGITHSIAETAERLNRLLSDDNLDRLTTSIANLETMSRDLNGLLTPEAIASAHTAIDNTGKAMGDLSTLSQNSQELVERLSKTADTLDSAAAALNTLVRDTSPHLTRFSREGLSDIHGAGKAVKKMADSIRTTSDKISQDPGQLLSAPASGGTAIPP